MFSHRWRAWPEVITIFVLCRLQELHLMGSYRLIEFYGDDSKGLWIMAKIIIGCYFFASSPPVTIKRQVLVVYSFKETVVISSMEETVKDGGEPRLSCWLLYLCNLTKRCFSRGFSVINTTHKVGWVLQKLDPKSSSACFVSGNWTLASLYFGLYRLW